MAAFYGNSCKYYGSAAGCRYGHNCRYSHNNPESVALCREYLDTNNCRYGNTCFYRHNIYETDIDIIKSNKTKNQNNEDTRELCTYFNSPYGCSRKDKCRFKHVKQEQPPPDDTLRLYSMNELTEMKLNIPQRQWQNAEEKDSSSELSRKYGLTIAQFNCLAQSLCYGVTDRVTFRCDKKYLIWEYRCKRILYEILQYKPDIICLQEIDNIHFKSFYFPNLSSMKYDGIFLNKNNINNGNDTHISLTDGIAIFWNTNKLFKSNDSDNNNQNKFECILGDKSECCQVALGVRLYLKDDKNVMFDVWNTHLKAGRSNESEDKRVKQCQILKEFMKKYSYKIPIILCGDLNLHFEPLLNEKGIVVKSTAYKYLTNNKDDDNKLIFKSLWNEIKDIKDRNKISCYAGWKTRDVKACFDYIMIGKWVNNDDKKNDKEEDNDFFIVEQTLNGFEEKDIEKFECRLPNQNYSSDHFLIAAKVAIQIETK